MSGWIDIRVRKPTAADGDKRGRILQRLKDDALCVCHWNDLLSVAAWMPIPELTPLPDPPEGWRSIPAKVAFKAIGSAMKEDPEFAWCWHSNIAMVAVDAGAKPIEANQQAADFMLRAFGVDVRKSGEWKSLEIIASDLPPKPPAPTYRPFKDAAEFDPFALKPWRFTGEPCEMRRITTSYSDKGHCGEAWISSLATKIFCDGTPFGVKVEE
jgi:hypothetical protein